MLGVPFEGPTYFFGDNMSVIITNITVSESVLRKKSISIAYHGVWEAVPMGEILPLGELAAYVVNMKSNTSYILTNVLPDGELRDKIVRSILPLGGHPIESWLSEHLSFEESEVIRVPGDRFVAITNTYTLFLFLFLDKPTTVSFLNPHTGNLRGLKNVRYQSVCLSIS